MDVDDVISDFFYEKLYQKIKKGRYDWVSAKFVHLEPDEQPDFTESPQKKDAEYHCKENESLLFINYDKDTQNGKFGVLPARIFRKEFITENEIYFPEGLMYEDNYWGAKCNLFSKDIYIIDEVLYCYYKNENSVVSSRNANYHLDRMKIEEMVVDLYREQGVLEAYYEQIEAHFIRRYYCGTWLAIFLKMDTIPDVLPEMRKKIYEWFPNYKRNPYVERLSPLDRALLAMLESEQDYTIEELEYIKEGYIKDFMRNYS